MLWFKIFHNSKIFKKRTVKSKYFETDNQEQIYSQLRTVWYNFKL